MADDSSATDGTADRIPEGTADGTAEGSATPAPIMRAVCLATHGTISLFDPVLEDWTTYIERVNFYFATKESELLLRNKRCQDFSKEVFNPTCKLWNGYFQASTQSS